MKAKLYHSGQALDRAANEPIFIYTHNASNDVGCATTDEGPNRKIQFRKS